MYHTANSGYLLLSASQGGSCRALLVVVVTAGVGFSPSEWKAVSDVTGRFYNVG